MYQIGSFSRMVGISVKTLRYYHEIDLLTPAKIDDASGYRYYSDDEFYRIERILLLKTMAFTLPEIKEVLDHMEDEADLQAYLLEKQDQITQRIQQLRKVNKQIQDHIRKEEESMNQETYDVEVVDAPALEVASIRYRGRFDEMGTYIGKLMGAVGGAAAGPVMSMCHDKEFKEEDADIEVCVPVKKPIQKGEVTTKTLPAQKSLRTLHVGSYERMGHAYKALMDKALDLDYAVLTPSREVYEKGPGMLLKGNPDKYRTVVYLPVADK